MMSRAHFLLFFDELLTINVEMEFKEIYNLFRAIKHVQHMMVWWLNKST